MRSRTPSRSKRFALLTVAFVAVSAQAIVLGVDYEEGGYAGTRDEGHGEVVYNFLKHFSYEQYYYAAGHQWTWNNDNRVDGVDFGVFAGHGNRWGFRCEDGTWVDLSSAGSWGDLGYGDNDCEFVAFESCRVVPSPIDVTDWYTNWTKAGAIFDGLHQALGFRSDSTQARDEDITEYFGDRIARNYAVWDAWLDAIDREGRSSEYGCAVMHPDADGDTYRDKCADPPRDHTALRCWYQY
ncbi:MAG: DUF6345 domain-containing protein [Planctomycetota bacterium]